jgi:peptidoglycan/xylan/chitin deacetylase (PgdA/CDA1 family)
MRLPILALLVLFGVTVAGQQPTPTQPRIAITFDDLPVHGPLPPGETRLQIAQAILSTLQANQMPPVYGFVNARRLTPADPAHISTNAHDITPANPDYAFLEAWRAAGEPLGNHTANHVSLDDLSATVFEQNILDDESTLNTLMHDEDWHWFRFPYLQEGDTLAKRRDVQNWLKAHHYRVAEVTMDFEDYLWNAPYARCVANHDEKSIQSLRSSFLATAGLYMDVYRLRSYQVYGREIPYVLLLHVGAFEAVMLPDLLKLYRRAGLQFVSLPEAESDSAYAQDPAIGVPGGGTLIDIMASKQKIPPPFRSTPYKELENTCSASLSK